MTLRPSYASITLALLTAASLGACGSGPSERTRVRPDVAARVAQGREFLGLPEVHGMGNVVRTEPAKFNADIPGLYADPRRAVAELRTDGFVAGIARTFKVMGRPDGASSTVVQMRDAAGARSEFKRELASARAPACPRPGCRRQSRTFAVPGVPGAVGLQVTLRMPKRERSEHPDVLRSEAIVFRDGAFVHQLWLGAARPAERRPQLIAAARAQAATR